MATTTTTPAAGAGEMQRTINWTGAFWVASGVPALVLFSIGGIGGVTGKLACLVWFVSMLMGFIQSFTYAEIAGLFQNKSGGAPIYGATAWLRYGKVFAPLSVWCYWFAWSPVLGFGSYIAAQYILNASAPIPAADAPNVLAWVTAHAHDLTASSKEVVDWLAANAGKTAQDAMTALLTQNAIAALTPAIRTWTLFGPDWSPFSFSAPFFIGAVLLLIAFFVQHRGILATSSVTMVVGLLVIIPMLIVGIVPLLNGAVDWKNLTNLVPPKVAYTTDDGAWNLPGWSLFLSGVFLAGWSTYGFETAVCYTREFKDPKNDSFRAIFYSGLLCLLLFSLVPFTFQGYLGVAGMNDPSILDGSGVAAAMARMVAGGNMLVQGLLVAIMILALILSIITAMAGSSRTLYQGSKDGWLPRYLSYLNENGAPTRAMWTDLIFNLFLLAIACKNINYFYLMFAISNVGYMIFNFMNLNAGWMHRIDSGHVDRPYRAPTLLLAAGTVLAFINAGLIGAGARIYNPFGNDYWSWFNPMWDGIIAALLIVPIFYYRHYIVDDGKFPEGMLEDIGLKGQDLGERKAGMLPYAALLGGVAAMLVASWIFFAPK